MKNLNEEKGSLIVEASIVFPVTFLVVVFLLFVGNLYYQRSKAQAIFTESVIEYAAEESNPALAKFVKTGSVMGLSTENGIEPYRYLDIFSGKGNSDVEKNVGTDLENMGSGLFSGMGVNVQAVSVEYKTYGIYAKVEAEMSYSITMPIRMLGQEEASKVEFQDYIEIPAMEGSEIVRNVDMVKDLLQRNEHANEVMDNASKYIEKFKNFAK